MKIHRNNYYLDVFEVPGRRFGWSGLQRLLARFSRTAVGPAVDRGSETETKVQQYLDWLRDQGPQPSGGQAKAVPALAAESRIDR